MNWQLTANAITSNGIYGSIMKHMFNDIDIEIHKNIYIDSIFPKEIFMEWFQDEERIFVLECFNEIVVEGVEIRITAY